MSSDGRPENSRVTENSQNEDDESAPPEREPAAKPKTPVPLKISPSRNVRSTISDVGGLEQNQEASGRSKEIQVIHPHQFGVFKSSEDLLLASSPNSLESQSTRMSNNAFRNFLRANFPSDLTIQNDPKSLVWAAKVLTREEFKSLVDKSTQSTVQAPSASEEASLGEVFSRHANTTASQQTQISPSVVPPRPVQGDPPLQGAPPSYSAVMRVEQGTPRRTFGRRLGSRLEPSPPFISRSPPPTYAEAQGRYYRPLVNVDSELLWGPDPMPAACSRCGCLVITAITSERSNLTHFAALGLCLCGCWPCCLLPYCMNSCKNTYHYCPNCNTYLGVYRPW